MIFKRIVDNCYKCINNPCGQSEVFSVNTVAVFDYCALNDCPCEVVECIGVGGVCTTLLMLNLGARQGERSVSRPGRFTGEKRIIMIVLTVCLLMMVLEA
jgi:hypothetical protein